MRFSKYPFTTFTVTVASPAVFSLTAHELWAGDVVILETTGALPTGLTADTKYYVMYKGLTEDTFRLSSTAVSEIDDGTVINTSGTQSGAHSLMRTNTAKLSPNIENTK